jgi:hypothetical protein
MTRLAGWLGSSAVAMQGSATALACLLLALSCTFTEALSTCFRQCGCCWSTRLAACWLPDAPPDSKHGGIVPGDPGDHINATTVYVLQRRRRLPHFMSGRALDSGI